MIAFLTAIFAVASSPAEPPRAAEPQCTQTMHASINVSKQGTADKAQSVMRLADELQQRIEAQAKERKTSLRLVGASYSIDSDRDNYSRRGRYDEMPSNAGYRYNINQNFNVLDASQAAAILDLLTAEKDIRASMNANTQQTCN